MGIEKYRVHEVAKDFGLPTKTITEILTKYVAAPKNHMQVLTDHELSVIFDYLTQKNPVSSIQTIFAEGRQEKTEAPVEKPAEKPAQPAASGQQGRGGQAAVSGKPGQQGQRPQGSGQKPPSSQPAASGQHVASTQKPAPGQQPAKPAGQKPAGGQQPASRVPQKKIVDTRKGGDVNLAKYDERLETLGGQQGERMQRQQRGGKEKFRNNSQRRGGMTFSNKRRQDEAEKMRRLQLEIAKKAPLKVRSEEHTSELQSR